MMALDVQYRSPEEITENVLNGIDAELENYEQRMVSNVINKFVYSCINFAISHLYIIFAL